MKNFKKLFASITAALVVLTVAVPMNIVNAQYPDAVTTAYNFAVDSTPTAITTQSLDNFRPYDNMTRMEAASFMARFMKDYYPDVPVLENASCDFVDVAVSAYNTEMVDNLTYVCERGIFGYGVGDYYKPQDAVTRAQMSTALYRVVDRDAANASSPYYYSASIEWMVNNINLSNSDPDFVEARWTMLEMMRRMVEMDVDYCDTLEVQIQCFLGECPAECTDVPEDPCPAGEELNEETGECEEVPVVLDGALDAGLSSATPPAANIPVAANAVEYLTFDLEADESDVNVTELVFTRQGLGSRDDFAKVRLTKDGVIISTDKTVASDDTVRFAIDWDIKAGATETYTLVAQMNVAAGLTKVNNFALTDIASTAETVSGLPVVGNSMTTVDYSVAKVSYENKGTASTVDVGAEDEILGEFKLSESETLSKKGVVVKSLRFKQAGSAKEGDLDNLTLYADGINVTKSVTVDGDYVTFVLDDYVLEDGKSKLFTIRGDVVAGDDAATVQFDLKETLNIYALEEGTNVGAAVEVKAGSVTTLAVYTLNAGKFTVSRLTTSDDADQVVTPSNQDVVNDTDEILLLVAKVDLDQNITVDKIRMYLDATSTVDTDADGTEELSDYDQAFENRQLRLNGRLLDSQDKFDKGDPTRGVAIVEGTAGDYVEFNVNDTLSDDDTLEVYVDVLNTAVADSVVKVVLSNVLEAAPRDGYSRSFQDVEYVSTTDKVKQADFAGEATSNKLTVVASNAGVSIVRNDGLDTTTNFMAGKTEAELMTFVVNAGNSSSLRISRLNFDVLLGGGGAVYSDFTNMKLMIDGVQIGSTESMLSAGAPNATVTFDSLDEVVPQNGQIEIALYGNISNSVVTPDTIKVTLDTSDSKFYDHNDDEVGIDNNGNGTADEAADDVASAVMNLLGNASLAVEKDGDTPNSAIVVADTSDVEVARYNLTATDGEVTLKEMYFANDSDNDNTIDTDIDARVSALKLVVNGEVVDTRTPSNGTVHFSIGSDSYVSIPQDDSVVVAVVADFNSITEATQTNKMLRLVATDVVAETADTGNELAVVNTTAEVNISETEAGHYSLANADVNPVSEPGAVVDVLLGTSDISSELMYIRKTVPTFATQDLGTTKLTNGEQVIYKVNVTADAAEDVEIGSITFNIGKPAGIADADVTNLKLFVNGSEVDATDVNGAYPLANAATTTFTFTAGNELVVSAGTTKTLEVKATLALVTTDEYLTVNVQEDAAAAAGTLDADGDGTYDNATDVGLANKLIRSDNAGSPHDHTTADRFNGFKVPGLDTISSTLEN